MGSPGGGGCIACRVKYPANATIAAVMASPSAVRHSACLEITSSGGGPPCIVTLGANATTSNHPGPTAACGQSTNQTRSGVSRMLSALMSTFNIVLPAKASPTISSIIAKSFRLRRDHSSSSRDVGTRIVANLAPTVDGCGKFIAYFPDLLRRERRRCQRGVENLDSRDHALDLVDAPRLYWVTPVHVLEYQCDPTIRSLVKRRQKTRYGYANWHVGHYVYLSPVHLGRDRVRLGTYGLGKYATSVICDQSSRDAGREAGGLGDGAFYRSAQPELDFVAHVFRHVCPVQPNAVIGRSLACVFPTMFEMVTLATHVGSLVTLLATLQFRPRFLSSIEDRV